MKKLTIILLLALTACQKSEVKPELPKITSQTFTANLPIPFIRLSLYYYGTTFNLDNTIIVFKPTASSLYLKSEDAIYFPGFGDASLSTLSSNGYPLAINTRPYKSNDTIPIKVAAKYYGSYKLKITLVNCPYQMCFLDNGNKCNMDSGFTINPADSSTFYKRFYLLIK